jgi:hypothetical protein
MSFSFINGLAMVSRGGKWSSDQMRSFGYEGEWGDVNKAGAELWEERTSGNKSAGKVPAVDSNASDR